MGCIASTSYYEDDEFLQRKRANDAIEHMLLKEQQQGKKETKLLLLGTGESGKSTVLKQLRLLHQGGFSHQERLQYLQVIWADAIQAMKILIIQGRKMGIKLECDQPSNTVLFECKRIVIHAKALDLIDPSIAGGSEFLNDYVVKYSERSEYKRRAQSTGVIDSRIESVNNFSSAPDMEEITNGLNELARGESQKLSKEMIARAIQTLWKRDRGIQQVFANANKFQLEGSASYYFDNIEKFAQPGYICTDEDILKGRIKTTGITETTFNIGSTDFKVLDAGGQRSERRKWIHCFEGITAVLFVLAVSEYDQMLFEDEQVNRMQEAMMLFDALCNSRWFINTPFILFLNKTDLLQEKIKRSPIRQFFPDYEGRLGDMEAGLKYFENIFVSLNRTKKPMYVHRTCATDSQSMKFVLSAVTDLIIQQNLKKSGLL